MINNDLKELPYKWYIKITNDNYSILNNYRKNIIKYCNNNLNKIYIGMYQDGSGGDNKVNDYQEISTEQFKQLVLKESVELNGNSLLPNEIYVAITSKKEWDSLFQFAWYEEKNKIKLKNRLYLNINNFKDGLGGVWTDDVKFKLATIEEKKWLNVCIKANKFIPKEDLDLYDDTTFELKTIQPKFEVGKWYKVSCGVLSYKKFLSLDKIRFYYSEEIYEFNHGIKHESKKNWLDSSFKFTLVTDLSEIQKYFPENHPDKIIEKQVERYKKLDKPYDVTTLNKIDVIPEYVECFKVWRGNENNSIVGKIYDTKISPDFSAHEWYNMSLWKNYFKISSKEAFDLQNKPKEITLEHGKYYSCINEDILYYFQFDKLDLSNDCLHILGYAHEDDRTWESRWQNWNYSENYSFKEVTEQEAKNLKVEENLLEEAKRKYTIGTKFKSEFNDKGIIRTIELYDYEKDDTCTWYWDEGTNGIRSKNGLCNEILGTCSNPLIYKDGIWAKIIENSKKDDEGILQAGDWACATGTGHTENNHNFPKDLAWKILKITTDDSGIRHAHVDKEDNPNKISGICTYIKDIRKAKPHEIPNNEFKKQVEKIKTGIYIIDSDLNKPLKQFSKSIIYEFPTINKLKETNQQQTITTQSTKQLLKTKLN